MAPTILQPFWLSIATFSERGISALADRSTASYALISSSCQIPPQRDATRSQRVINKTLWIIVVLILIFLGGAGARIIYKSTERTSQQSTAVHRVLPSLLDATIDTLMAGLTSNDFTRVDLVKAYIARISEVQDIFYAVTEINPDALAIAAILDAERAHGQIRGSLHGIPLLIKNNIATFDEMNNTCSKVPRDATVVRKLRAEGAIILGKTSLSQWANFRSINSSNGWSALGGQVYGPCYPHQDPWGSSNGSGVATTLGLTSGSLGTETDGSLTGPASYNNLVTIKPNAARILQAISGKDPHDNYTSLIPNFPNYIAACKLSGLSGRRIGVPRNAIALQAREATSPEIEAFEWALQILKDAGAVVVDNTNFTAAEEYWHSDIPLRILEADFVINLQEYLSNLAENPRNITSLAELYNFTRQFPQEDWPRRDTEIWDAALDGYNNTSPLFWPAYQRNLFYGAEGGLLGALERYRLDAIVLPANSAAHWAATVGAPVVTVSLGFYPVNTTITKNSWGLVQTAPGIPFGLSFLGDRFTEAKLIGIAYAFEQKTKVRDRGTPFRVPQSGLAEVIEKKKYHTRLFL